MSGTYPRVVDAIEAGQGVHDRGFTFVGARPQAEGGGDLYLSFHALREEVQKRAHHLRALGLRKGDRVALVVPDGHEFVPTFLGALWAGLVPVPLYPPLSLGKLDAFMESLTTILAAAAPRVLVAGAQVEKLLWGVMGKVATLEKLVLSTDLGKPVEHALHRGLLREALEDSDLAFLQFTSGSTSLPKGVMVTHGSLAANAKAILTDGLKADPKTDKGVTWLPLYHDMGLIGFVIAPLTVGIPVVFIPTLSFIKNSTLWMETIHKHRGTISFAPNFAYALVTKRAKPEQLAKWDLSCMRVFGCGAEPINPDTMRAFVEGFSAAKLRPESLLPCYGMAEATLAMAFIPLEEPLRTDRIDEADYHAHKKATPLPSGSSKPALEVVCCGKTFPGHGLSIRDESGRELPERTVGEICFRGPSVAAGYYNNPEATKAAGMGPGTDGWLHTGDLGYLAEGEVFISGRLKDILIINGRNYYPQRIEWVTEEVPGVRKGSAVVFSRPGKSSEEVVVCLETRDAEPEKLAEAIKAKVSEELSLQVSDVRMVAPGALPKTSSGKLQRRKTREQYLAGTLGQEGVRTLGGMGSRLLIAKHLAYSLFGRAQHAARGLLRRKPRLPKPAGD
jgi:fatty-acyl-CoA synthase